MSATSNTLRVSSAADRNSRFLFPGLFAGVNSVVGFATPGVVPQRAPGALDQ